jgi:hypothetical protein
MIFVLAAAVLAAEAEKAITPFNGEDLKGWKFKGPEEKSHWNVARALWSDSKPQVLALGNPFVDGKKMGDLVNFTPGGVDIYTEEKFGDCVIEVEFMIPKGSNSGVYVMGEYEVQIFDSYGKEKLAMSDLGAIYSAAVPNVNASKKPGEWQKFVIDFNAPRYEGDKKVANARFIKVVLNGQTIHENVEIKGPTPSGVTGKEAPTGPLMFQGDHGPVAFRNIKVTPKGGK